MSRLRFALAVGGALFAAWALASPAPAPTVYAASPAKIDQAMPSVAIVTTLGGRSELRLVRPDRAGDVITTFEHLEGSVRAALLPDGAVLAAAPLTPGDDRSFDGGLWKLEPSGAELLCDALTHASRPLVTPDGRVFVARGTAGEWFTPTEMRVDHLTVDEIDPASGVVVTLHRFRGYLVHLAGWHDGRVLVYRVGPNIADLVAIDADSGDLKTVRKLPPFARDFSVDGDRLVYRERDDRDSRVWVVETIDLSSGRSQRLHEGPSFSVAPHAWPGGGIALSPEGRGLELLGSRDRLHAPLGAGVDVVRAVSSDGRFVALLHTREGALDVPFVVDRRSSSSFRLPVPAGTRVDIAGFTIGGAP